MNHNLNPILGCSTQKREQTAPSTCGSTWPLDWIKWLFIVRYPLCTLMKRCRPSLFSLFLTANMKNKLVLQLKIYFSTKSGSDNWIGYILCITYMYYIQRIFILFLFSARLGNDRIPLYQSGQYYLLTTLDFFPENDSLTWLIQDDSFKPEA